MTKTNVFITTMTLAIALFAFGGTASASIISAYGVGADAYALEATFLASKPYVVTESFESFGLNTGAPLTTVFGTLAGTGHVGDSTTRQAKYGEFATDGNQYWSNQGANSKGDFTFSFNQPVYQFGFYGTDFHDQGGEVKAIFHLVGGATELVNFHDLMGVSSRPPSGVPAYFLVQSTLGVESVEFLQSGNDGYAIDAVSTVTPIPGAVWLLGTGLLGLIGLRRKNR